MKIFSHLKSNWIRYGFETLAVVVGILAAFALENWNEERKERNQTTLFLDHIASNLEEDLEEIHRLKHYGDSAIMIADSILGFFKNRSFDEEYTTRSISFLIVEKRFQVNRSGMDALINSGSLDLLSPSLTYLLQRYYALCGKLAERQEISNGFIQNKYETHWYDHYVEATRTTDYYGIRKKYADDPRPEYRIKEERIMNDAKMEVLVLIRLVHSESEKELYIQLIESARELKAHIENIISTHN